MSEEKKQPATLEICIEVLNAQFSGIENLEISYINERTIEIRNPRSNIFLHEYLQAICNAMQYLESRYSVNASGMTISYDKAPVYRIYLKEESYL